MSKKGATSSHTIEAKSGALRHNRREAKLSNVNPNLTHLNESWESPIIKRKEDGGEGRSIDSLTKERADHYLMKHGRSAPGFGPNGKSVPPDRRTAFIRESCVVIKPETTLEDVRRFADSVCSEFGVKCLGIWLHKDEGHHRSKYIEGDSKWKPNLHAHVLFDWYLFEKGRVARSTSNWYSQMQDMAAAALNMERGEKSERKHIASKAFAEQQAEQRIAMLEDKVAQLQRSIKAQTKQLEIKKRELEDAQKRNDKELPKFEAEYLRKKQMLEDVQRKYKDLSEQLENDYLKEGEQIHNKITDAKVELFFVEKDLREKKEELKALSVQVADIQDKLDTTIDNIIDNKEALSQQEEALAQQEGEIADLAEYFRKREQERYENIGAEVQSRIIELEKLQVEYAKSMIQIAPDAAREGFRLLPVVSRRLILDLFTTYDRGLHSFFMGGSAPGVNEPRKKKRRGDDDDDEYSGGYSR